VTPFYPQKLALTSPSSGGISEFLVSVQTPQAAAARLVTEDVKAADGQSAETVGSEVTSCKHLPTMEPTETTRKTKTLVADNMGKVGWSAVDWIDPAQDRNRWKSSCEWGDEPSGSINAGKLSSGLSSSAQLHRVSLFSIVSIRFVEDAHVPFLTTDEPINNEAGGGGCAHVDGNLAACPGANSCGTWRSAAGTKLGTLQEPLIFHN
jgi:hypothetical protein